MRLRFYGPIAGAILLACVGAASVSAQATAAQPSAQAVVTTYFKALDTGMKSGDFTALVSLYAPDATLTQSNPKGVTRVFHGPAAITGFYRSLAAMIPGYQWTRDSERVLAPTVVLSYEHAGSPPLALPGRCAHLFVVQNGKIASADWVVFYPGKPAAASTGAGATDAPAAPMPADPHGIRRGPRPV